MLYLRVIFTILSAVCIAALIPLGALFGWAWVGYCFLGALLFFVFMLLCKQSQDIKALKSGREKQSPTTMENSSVLADVPATQEPSQDVSTTQEKHEMPDMETPAKAKGATPKT